MSEPATFIASWLKAAASKAHDQDVLKAISENMTMEVLDEGGLLASLLALSRVPAGAQDAQS